MDDSRKLLFGSVIAYGMLFCALLAAAGIWRGIDAVVTCAVACAGGSYVTQVLSAFFNESRIKWLPPAIYAVWVATALCGVVGLVSLIGG